MHDISSYRIINLTSGDNLIGKVESKGEESLVLHRPYQMKVITLMDKAGPMNMFRQEALVLRNWLDLSKEDKVSIPINQIITITEPTKKVSEIYNDEMEKEDNPAYLAGLVDKLKKASVEIDEDEEDEDLEDIDEEELLEDYLADISVEIDPADIRDMISQIIKGVSENNIIEDEADTEYNDSDENQDTDNEMHGW